MIEEALPIGNPSTFWRREALWRHYEAMATPLVGFHRRHVTASINPVFGQGIGMAAWEASVLRAAMLEEAGLQAWTRRYLSVGRRRHRTGLGSKQRAFPEHPGVGLDRLWPKPGQGRRPPA